MKLIQTIKEFDAKRQLKNLKVMSDDEIEIEAKRDEEKLRSWKEKREKELGFRPQHELFHNFYLPYDSSQLDEESNKLLDHIKDNLGLSIASREIYPSAGIFITKLMR